MNTKTTAFCLLIFGHVGFATAYDAGVFGCPYGEDSGVRETLLPTLPSLICLQSWNGVAYTGQASKSRLSMVRRSFQQVDSHAKCYWPRPNLLGTSASEFPIEYCTLDVMIMLTDPQQSFQRVRLISLVVGFTKVLNMASEIDLCGYQSSISESLHTMIMAV